MILDKAVVDPSNSESKITIDI